MDTHGVRAFQRTPVRGVAYSGADARFHPGMLYRDTCFEERGHRGGSRGWRSQSLTVERVGHPWLPSREGMGALEAGGRLSPIAARRFRGFMPLVRNRRGGGSSGLSRVDGRWYASGFQFSVGSFQLWGIVRDWRRLANSELEMKSTKWKTAGGATGVGGMDGRFEN